MKSNRKSFGILHAEDGAYSQSNSFEIRELIAHAREEDDFQPPRSLVCSPLAHLRSSSFNSIARADLHSHNECAAAAQYNALYVHT